MKRSTAKLLKSGYAYFVNLLCAFMMGILMSVGGLKFAEQPLLYTCILILVLVMQFCGYFLYTDLFAMLDESER